MSGQRQAPPTHPPLPLAVFPLTSPIPEPPRPLHSPRHPAWFSKLVGQVVGTSVCQLSDFR